MAQINWNHPDLLKLPPEKINLLKCISNDLNNMSSNASIAYILTLNSKLKEQNITFSKEEYNIILNAISGNLPNIFEQK